ncbi:LytR/AlgR family response regulator transcription factor [Flectobacillus roseus]|uniref:Response regulator transcription factor n=1 Tax=Flectobacillus roseus TaxID=502259 RepID=A0ABT6Y5Z7_9BACT|nr:response regulator transcription factor [Flectobacillus roseus]MDI9858990.1 response regulator transcription factor [Flectobacillus roseus]
MQNFTAIVLDDSFEEAKILIDHLENIPNLRDILFFNSPHDAMVYLSSNKADILFLDMEMPELNGLEFLKDWASTLPTIVISSHTNYAIDCFDKNNIVDFIQKPVTFNRLLRALNRVYQIMSQGSNKDVIWLKVGRQIQQFNLNDIIYIEADGIYSKIWNTDKSYTLVNDNISEIEQRLQGTKLLRLHKSYIFNSSQIKSIDSKSIFIANKQFPIGVTFKDKLEDILSLYNHSKQ